MPYFYTSPTSNIPPQPHRSAIRMTRTDSSSSTTSTASNSSSISIPSPYNPSSQPGSSSASFSSSYWPSSSSTTCSSPSSYANRHSHSRHNSNGTSYLPTPFRSALLNSSSVAASSSSSSSYNPHSEPSSYFSDDELLSLSLESVHLDGTSTVPNRKREMTTEEQVAAVREQVEREREGGKSEAWWSQGIPAQQPPVTGMEKRSRVVRFASETRKASGQGKRRSVVMGGKGSNRRD
ncbi:hypothetical protein GJ744_000656 [Endocarpon pusillum]|uniref:Uncharacterized protein n=1 Tax=Endocarpon pusillum TaxID=364733 RepID=A0A8H7AED5_9EURO|nr:hypothetical protein GJ744_000656 [Endocarpon pusillum]